jgi:hypothetical protein
MSNQGGTIITFYSYKGGVGRTMALGNIAWILASNGKRVLTIDWDLEAPGLHRYFRPFLEDKDLQETRGVINFVRNFEAAMLSSHTNSSEVADDWYVTYADITPYKVSLERIPGGGQLDFVPAGMQRPSYSRHVNTFDWHNFYRNYGGYQFFEAFKANLRTSYDYILIDSRTGLSDTSGICTVQLPDIVVVCLTYNDQNMTGAAAVAHSILAQSKSTRIFPVPMRVEVAEKDKLDMARERCRQKFDLFLAHLPEPLREEYWGRTEVIYQPFYAYEEILATIGDQPGSVNSMLASMERITSYLTDNEVQKTVALADDERDVLLGRDPVLAEIRAFLAVDPLRALNELIRAEHRARLRSLGEAHRIGLRSLRAEFMKYRSDLLRQVNQHYREQHTGVLSYTSSGAHDAVAPTWSPDNSDPVEPQSLQDQLFHKQENLRLIQERITEYILTADAPLQYRTEERQCIADIQRLEQQLGVEIAPYDEPELREGLAQDLLNLIALFRSDSLGMQLAILRPVIANLPTSELVNGLQVLNAAIGLWNNFNQIVRALVVSALVWIREQNDADLEQLLEQAFSAKRELRRLSTDVSLHDWPIIQKFAAPDYIWPLRIKRARAERSEFVRFLNDTGLKANPFQPGAAQFDPLLLASYAPVPRADDISSPRPMLLVSSDQQDRDSLRLLMGSQNQQLGLPPGLPAVCDLTDEFKIAPQPLKVYLGLIARDAARAWLEFLSLNAGAWFDLTLRQQRSLVDLLVWREQSKQRLLDLLPFTGLDEGGEVQAVIEEFAALLGTAAMVAQPEEADLLRWLEVHPPLLNYTYALLDCPFKASQEIQAALNGIVEVSDRLLEVGVVLKVFAAEAPMQELGDDLDVIPISWSERNLAQMLDDRVRLVAEHGYQRFADLFYPDDRAEVVTIEFIRASAGSLGRLQRLGQGIIRAHVAERLNDWDVDTALKTIHEQR